MADVEPLSTLLGPAADERNTQCDLARAVAVAAVAHAGQIDKSGNAYILHPMRVMQRCRPHGTTAEIVAILHDTVEDTWITLDHLRELRFSDEVVEAVDAISQRKGAESYFQYIERCAGNRVAALVKLADLDDNSDPLRRFGRDFDSLVRRYDRARRVIEAKLADIP